MLQLYLHFLGLQSNVENFKQVHLFCVSELLADCYVCDALRWCIGIHELTVCCVSVCLCTVMNEVSDSES